ncbi:hypothetical protein RM844_26290 [Streptomyces sp. DSM 44915]|uniref:DUF202 domain-containing protein n=1 Tax=Streptomyces chisholmiae TaxID=3075540 RepID=A0ABU2JYI8_9ACTN|nr:DUF202 domain-containing protein [Streptomyces sp. DSM 44915]MDT0269799.1 hypothetical protein [Streptomyces sp. DSM 44915]
MAAVGRAGPVEPGGQAERTQLAWRRTTLAFALALALAARGLLWADSGVAVAGGAVAAGALLGGGFLALAQRRMAALAADPRAELGAGTALLAAAVVALLAVAAGVSLVGASTG